MCIHLLNGLNEAFIYPFMLLLFSALRGTHMQSVYVTHAKEKKIENLYYLVTNVFGASKPILWYPNISFLAANSIKTCNLSVDLGKKFFVCHTTRP